MTVVLNMLMQQPNSPIAIFCNALLQVTGHVPSDVNEE